METGKLKYVVTADSDMTAPRWLNERLNKTSARFFYRIRDGAMRLRGVRVGNDIVEIGDTIILDDNGLSIERR